MRPLLLLSFGFLFSNAFSGGLVSRLAVALASFGYFGCFIVADRQLGIAK